MKQEKLLAALLGDHLRNDGMIERFCGILRGNGARLIAISEEILARLLVADDTDLEDAFPLGKSSVSCPLKPSDSAPLC